MKDIFTPLGVTVSFTHGPPVVEDGVGVTEIVVVTDGVTDGDTPILLLGVTDGVTDGVSLGVTDGVTDGVSLGVTDGVTLDVGVGVRLGVTDGVTLDVGVGVTLGVTDGVGVGDSNGASHVPSPIVLIVTPNSTKLFVNPDVAGNKQTHCKFMVAPSGRGMST